MYLNKKILGQNAKTFNYQNNLEENILKLNNKSKKKTHFLIFVVIF